MRTLAPIVLFTYNRPWHTQQTIEALQKNELAKESELFIYSDGAKNDEAVEKVNEVREYINKIVGFKKITIKQRDKNWGLADSIIDGVTSLVNKYGKIIVLEDDIVTSPYFLKFMNDALDFYESEEKVWHISGWNYPIENITSNETFLWRVMNCWGWATWKNKWKYFEKDPEKLINTFDIDDIYKFNIDGTNDFWSQVTANKEKRINSWAIFWYATIFKHDGLCLNPSTTFIDNIGIDNSGTHCTYKKNYTDNISSDYNIIFEKKTKESNKNVEIIKDYLSKRNHFLNINISNINLSNFEKKEIKKLLIQQSFSFKNVLNQMWYLLDLVWDEYKCDNKNLNWEIIGKYYSHPVWLLNGLFIEQHEVSIRHRSQITSWISLKIFNKILDFGGGFGTLATYVSKNTSVKEIQIYEPHPSSFGIKRLKEYKNIKIVDKLDKNYDCLISTDVLEHIENPLETFFDMIGSVKLNGYLIIANCFKPVIKCHLPKTFDLDYTFDFFAIIFGLRVYKKIEESHITIYKKNENKEFSLEEIAKLKKQSELLHYKTKNNSQFDKRFLFNKSFFSSITSLEELKQTNEKYILYGAGTGAKYILYTLQKQIEFIVDKNLINSKIANIDIYPIEKLKNTKNKIIISVFGREEIIIDFLKSKYKIAENRIIVLDL
jgi:2-polyprenyl-3-methyl-5-hydroxy-6-metoxy-1,4-benzoquinol methylase